MPYNPATGTWIGGAAPSIQGGGSPGGAAPSPQSTIPTSTLQPAVDASQLSAPAAAPNNAVIDPSIAAAANAAAAAKAAEAAKAQALRGQITSLANSVKDIFNSRYGQVDAAAQEQSGSLNDRFGKESSDITTQIGAENAKLGAAHASAGTYDSSYRGNNVDTVTHAGESQISDLGTELRDNLAKIASFVTSTKAGFDAQKGGIDSVLSHLGEETDPNNLATIRGTLESRIADLKAGSADNNTQAQNLSTLATIAPSTPRAQQLKTTLSQIVAGSADSAQKSAIGEKLIASANLDPAEAEKLRSAFQGELVTPDKQPTA